MVAPLHGRSRTALGGPKRGGGGSSGTRRADPDGPAQGLTASDAARLVPQVLDALATPGEGVDAAWELVAGLTSEAPFDPALAEVITAAVQRIEEIETERGEIARSERSALAPEAQRYQELIDRLLFAMAGLSVSDAEALVRRLQEML